MDNPRARLQALLMRKRKEDPEGFMKAERNSDLLYYLAADMRKLGIEIDVLKSHLRMSSQEAPFVTQEVDEYVNIAAKHLDDNVYEPFYQLTRSEGHMGIADAMGALKASSSIDKQLRFVKVGCAASAVLCFGLSIGEALMSKKFQSLLLLVISADLFRVSYNCYMKTYCSIFLEVIGGDWKRTANTIFSVARTAVGAQDTRNDPFVRLKNEVIWELLWHNSICKMIYLKIRANMK